MKDKVFIDTNIWIYGLTESKLKVDKGKREISLKLFENLVEKGSSICISMQVVNECHWNFVKRFDIEDMLAIKLIQENIISISEVKDITLSVYELSNRIRHKYNLSFWDSLIVASALENECSILYTEDLQHEQVIEGKLKIINPFEEQGQIRR